MHANMHFTMFEGHRDVLTTRVSGIMRKPGNEGLPFGSVAISDGRGEFGVYCDSAVDAGRLADAFRELSDKLLKAERDWE